MGLNLKKHLLCIICLGFEILCKSSLFNKSWLVLWCLHYGALFHVSNHGPDSWRSELMHYIHNQKDIVSNPTRYSAGSWDTTHYKAPFTLLSNECQTQWLSSSYWGSPAVVPRSWEWGSEQPYQEVCLEEIRWKRKHCIAPYHIYYIYGIWRCILIGGDFEVIMWRTPHKGTWLFFMGGGVDSSRHHVKILIWQLQES